MAAALEDIDAGELLVATYAQLVWFVKGLLAPGCYILASKPKLGKTIMLLQLGVSLVTGKKFLDFFEVSKAGVCLLELEDGIRRAQGRLWRIADELPPGFRIVEKAERLDTGLLDQIKDDLKRHPETGVYVIDTFAAVRPAGAEYSYQSDYGCVKSLADLGTALGVCIILVHHCRKSVAFGDAFDDISGTTGLTAGATGMIVLAEDKRDSDKVVICAKGKDIEKSAWQIQLVDGKWRMVEEMTPLDIVSCTMPECILQTVRWMGERCDKWSGFTNELYDEVGIADVSLNAYGKYLAQHKDGMLKMGVDYVRRHTRNGNVISLVFCDGVDDTTR